MNLERQMRDAWDIWTFFLFGFCGQILVEEAGWQVCALESESLVWNPSTPLAN